MSGLASVLEVTVASRDVERQVCFCRSDGLLRGPAGVEIELRSPAASQD